MIDSNRILITSPNQKTLDDVENSLQNEGFLPVRASGKAEVDLCLKQFEDFAGAIIDLSSGEEQLSLLGEISERLAARPLLAVVPQADINLAIEGIKKGAYDYILEPVITDEIAPALQFIMEKDFSESITRARLNNWKYESALGRVYTGSDEMIQKLQLIGLLAHKDTSILLTGPEGVGKLYFGQIIHFLSLWRFQPFVRVNCQQVTPLELIFEKLGYRFGRKESWGFGTLFLRDFFNLQSALQLFVLDYVRARAENAPLGSGIRLILSCDDLVYDTTQSNNFIHHFQATGGAVIEIPTLERRLRAVPELAQTYLNRLSQEFDQKKKKLSENARTAVLSYAWPENTSELYIRLGRAFWLSESDIIEPEQLGLQEKTLSSIKLDLQSFDLSDVEETLIQKALQKTGHNVSRTANELGISRGTLYNKMKKYGFEDSIKEKD